MLYNNSRIKIQYQSVETLDHRFGNITQLYDTNNVYDIVAALVLFSL